MSKPFSQTGEPAGSPSPNVGNGLLLFHDGAEHYQRNEPWYCFKRCFKDGNGVYEKHPLSVSDRGVGGNLVPRSVFYYRISQSESYLKDFTVF